ncbi:hypothetical protein EMIT0P4_10287 [Pseudomonas sp. IT-P4]
MARELASAGSRSGPKSFATASQPSGTVRRSDKLPRHRKASYTHFVANPACRLPTPDYTGNTPLPHHPPGEGYPRQKTLSRALDMPRKWDHLRGAVVQFLESLESLCRLPLSWLPNWKSSHSSTWTVPRKV